MKASVFGGGSWGMGADAGAGAVVLPIAGSEGVRCMLIGGVLSVAWVAVGILIVLICVSLDA